jgi:aerobic C4-dicarboxylate transport protein
MPYMKKLLSHLTFQVIVAIVLGIVVGYHFPQFAAIGKLLSQTFINMITMLIAPIIFLTIVLGIAHLGNMKKVGRIGIKALIYFELITTLALSIGLIVANLIQPGEGVAFSFNTNKAAVQQFSNQPPFNWGEFISHIVPHNVFDAFTKGDVLQILFFAILFGFGLAQLKAE